MEHRSPQTVTLIAQTKEAAERAKNDLLKTFAFIPEERLGWSPSATARTPVWLVAHCGAANGAFAALLRGTPFPMPTDPAARAALIFAGGRDVTTRTSAIRAVEDSTASILQALDAVTDDQVTQVLESAFGALPFPFWMNLPASHMDYHRCQLAYLQTIWGDLQDH